MIHNNVEETLMQQTPPGFLFAPEEAEPRAQYTTNDKSRIRLHLRF